MTDRTQPAVDAIKAEIEATVKGMVTPYSNQRSNAFIKTCAGMIACALARFAGLAGAVPGRVKSNALYGCHQFTISIPGDTAYRAIIAPMKAPVSIGGVPADEHFSEPLEGDD